jgi:RNA polymerase primary sigma factor
VETLTNEALREALENLSYRERRVLELRYGLGGKHPRTLGEVGRTFNVTRERIRQIESQSLKTLQNLPEAQKLSDDIAIASG